jgi:hypothetical protein
VKRNCHFVTAVAVFFTLLLSSGPVFAYTVTGNVNNPGEYTLAGSLWNVLQGTNVTFGANPQYRYQYPCYTDSTVPCIALPQPPYAQNDINHNTVDTSFVLVTGKDGSRALYSVGELNPKFSPNTAQIVVTCTGQNKEGRGGACDLAGAGRSVKDIAKIEVAQAVPGIHYNGKYEGGARVPFTHFYSSVIVVSGDGITPKAYDLVALQKLTQSTFDASRSTTNTAGVWKGPSLLDVLRVSGVDTQDMDGYVVVQATDGYATVLSMYEATRMAGAQNALLAISGLTKFKGTPNTQTINCRNTCGDEDGGLARLVLPNDLVAGRWFSNVSQIVAYKLPHKDR